MINILLSQYNFHEKWSEDIMKKYINSSDRVAVIPFAFSDKYISNDEEWENAYNKDYGKYYGEMIKPFLELGIKETNITLLNFFRDTEGRMKKVIESSEIVFLTGGLPDMAVKHILEKNLLDNIKKSKVVIGVSAGALMQLNNYYISPDKDYPEFNYFKGLGLIKDNFYIEVHYSGTESENICIRKALEEKTDIVYGITNTGGVVVDNEIITVLGDVNRFEYQTSKNHIIL